MFKLFNSRKANAANSPIPSPVHVSPVHKQGSPSDMRETSPSDIGEINPVGAREAFPMDESEVSPAENFDTSPVGTPATSSMSKKYVSPTEMLDISGEEKFTLNRANTARRASHKRSVTAITSSVSSPAGVKESEKMVFFTHNWGEQHANHKLCSEINAYLKTQGIDTWFDEERMTGQIVDAMVNGLDNAACLLIAVTKTCTLLLLHNLHN